MTTLTTISPIDGRYFAQTQTLSPYFSEFALMRYRVWVEVEYFIALCELNLPQLQNFDKNNFQTLRNFYHNFSLADAEKIKEIEKTTNHDVKAVEYFIKDFFAQNHWQEFSEFVHFGLTSQDINNTAIPLSLKDALQIEIIPTLRNVLQKIREKGENWQAVPMLARTHGQPATPTTMGKEWLVFAERLTQQIHLLSQIPFSAKFGGATGNMNAHFVAFPEIDWHNFASRFLQSLG
ncbi:MAG: lyase family protein, partial [Raineya sp.]|nr:lyase family protein [Raineya sp.]